MFDSLIDQKTPVQILKTILKKGLIPNSLLFTGIEGIGKKNAAIFFSMAANCAEPGAPCHSCRSCKKILSENHPDIHQIEPQGILIKISQVRDLLKILNRKPFEARRRFVIIQNVHLINTEAGNSLLKILEEPPEKTHFILTTSQIENLLPTIVSRSQQIRFNPISNKSIAHHLINQHKLEEPSALLVSEMANGSLTNAEKMIDRSGKTSNWINTRNFIVDKIENMSNMSTYALFAFASSLVKKKETAIEHLEIIKMYLRDIIIFKYYPEKIIFKDLLSEISNASEKNTIPSILDRIDAVNETQKRIQSNSNPRLALEMLMIRMARV